MTFQKTSSSQLADSRVSLGPKLDRKQEQEILVTSGSRCLEYSLNFGLESQSFCWKMSRVLLLSRTDLYSRIVILHWKRKVTKHKRLIYQLAASVRSTKEVASSSSPSTLLSTPNTMDYLPQRSPEALVKQATGARKGRSRPGNLREQVDKETSKLWSQAIKRLLPTPCAKDWKDQKNLDERVQPKHRHLAWVTQNIDGFLPTPQAADCRDRGHLENPAVQRRIKMGKQIMLSIMVKPSKKAGSLCPRFVEYLMGFPRNFVNIS